MFDRSMLADILTAYGPSGREENAVSAVKPYVAPYADEVYTDALGNLIAHKKGTSGKKVMISAHIDQIGLVVTDIDEAGFLRCMNVGGVNPQIAIARKVRFKSGVRGVTYFETKEKAAGTAVMKELFIDIGASTREEAQSKVEIGDVAVYDTELIEMGERLSCGAMDDRVCCAVMIEAFKAMKTDHDVYAVFTVQEEVGLRGAGAAAYAIEPDLNINIDVTLVGDTPKCARMSVSLGEGPAVKVMDSSLIVPVCVRDFMCECAKSANIKYQLEVLFGGGTDTAAVQRTKSGVYAGCVSIPCRYVHSPVETVDRRDLEGAVALIVEMLKRSDLPKNPLA